MDVFPFEQASRALGTKLYAMLSAIDGQTKADTQEIRLRTESKICLRVSGELQTLENLPAVSKTLLGEAFESICGYSVYSHQRDIAQGFVTVQGGHRAGVCGTAVVSEGKVTMLREITSINLRVARDCRGCAAKLFELTDYKSPCGILIAGAPMSGKTTLLRDMAAYLSTGFTGRRYAVSVLDSRGELAAVHNGVPQYECMSCCDILSGFPRGEGIIHALRSMSPEIIICDEVGNAEESKAILEGLNAGVCVIASVHACSEYEMLSRPAVRMLIETGAFKYAVILEDKPFGIEKIIKTEDIRNENRSLHFDNAGFSSDRLWVSA